MKTKNKVIGKLDVLYIPIILGIILGLLAKLIDTPEMNSVMPIFDYIFGRFGVWIFAATLLATSSDAPKYAAIRVFSFFISMLLTYYVYTILFLGFFPKSQIILWSVVSLLSPICAAIMWYARNGNKIANVIAAMPIAALCLEWYFTGMENGLLLLVYFCMTVCLLIYIPKKSQNVPAIVFFAAVMTFLLIKMGFLNLVFENLLNI